MFAYDFLTNEVPGSKPHEEQGYWRDVGTIGAYWQAHMDLLGAAPLFDLDNPQWPILTAAYGGPATHVIGGDITDSLIGEGCHIANATVRRSILGRGVRIEPGAVVEESIVMDHTVVGRGAHLRRVIADRYNLVAEGDVVGIDHLRDAQRYQVDGSGIVVLPRGSSRFS